MRLALVAVVAALAAPASAQILDDLGGRRAAICAADLLDALTESRPADPPTMHVGLATWFMGCTYYLPPAIGPILNAMQADIDTIYRHRGETPGGELEDVSAKHRWALCRGWWAVYASIYRGLIPEFGDGIVGDLPTPEEYSEACERWVRGRAGR